MSLQQFKLQFMQCAVGKTNPFVWFTLLQSRAANSLAILLELCMSREPCPNSKIVKNLCTFACSDPSTTPAINLNMTLSTDEAPASPVSAGAPSCPLASQTGQGVSGNDKERTIHCDQYNGILTLVQQHKVCDYH